MEEFGKEREEWLKKFLELPHGIPDSDTFRRVFERIKPEALSECLYDWLGCHRQEGSVIAVDGKTIRGSKTDSHKAYHVVSAFAAENQLVLGEIVTDEKSNEITAVPGTFGFFEHREQHHNGGRNELPERNCQEDPGGQGRLCDQPEGKSSGPAGGCFTVF